MIKNLNKDDIQVTPFIAQKSWNLQNLDDEDLILWMSGSLTGELSVIYTDYGDGSTTPYVNSSSYLALQQQDVNSYITYQRGIKKSGTFFTEGMIEYVSGSNPRNQDGSYMRVVYNTHQRLFFNTYDNPTELLGLENINLSSSMRLLTDAMDVFSLNKSNFGEKIVPNSVVIYDNQFDEAYTIVDDGKTNLILSGSYFNKFQELSPI
jgi:hypothetical protein